MHYVQLSQLPPTNSHTMICLLVNKTGSRNIGKNAEGIKNWGEGGGERCQSINPPVFQIRENLGIQ